MAQYKVPQNIDVEDRVIGPLTIRQFLILLATGGIILLLNLLLGSLGPIFFMLAIMIGIIGAGIAFFKYGDQNAETFIIAAFKTMTSPRKRAWKKEEPKEEQIIEKPVESTKKPEVAVARRASLDEARSHLERLAEVVDSSGYSAINQPPASTTSKDAQDLLKKVEETDEDFEGLITKANKKVPKRDKLVSEIATVMPDERLKKTQTIETTIKKF